MSKEKIRLIHTVYAVLLGLLALALGICFIIGCLDIYGSGPRPFSRESVAEHFAAFAVLAYAFMALTAGGLVLNLVLPLENGKKNRKPNLKDKLSSASKSADFESFPPEVSFNIKREQKKRLILFLSASLLYAAAFIASLVFILVCGNSKNIDIQALVLISALILPFAFSVFVTYYRAKSINREIILLRSAPPVQSELAQNEQKTQKKPFFEANRKKISAAVRFTILGAGIVLTVIGIFTGGIEELLKNAIKLCQSCVGIG